MAFDFNECMDKGFLRRIPKSQDNAARSLKTARDWLEEAERNSEAEAYNSGMISCYLAMFHAARAILYRDGFREKSHACIARYLEAKYARNGKLEMGWVNLLDRYRDLRHDSQYGIGGTATKRELEDAFDTATRFVERMEALVKH